MAHLFIKDIKPGQILNDVFMVTQPVLRNTTRGDLYIAMFLSDRTGKVNARMWQATEAIYNSLPTEGFVQIQGKSELYQNALQIVVNNVAVVDADNVDLSDYMPKTEKNIREMFSDVRNILGTINNKDVRILVDAFLSDESLMREFCKAPAAMQMHHSYLGGLLEHTHNMLNVAQAILPFYPKIQADIVLAGIFLHDIAKTRELSYKMGFCYTNTGQLIGHLVQGSVMLEEKAKAIQQQSNREIDRDILDSLIHIMISHHGRPEFGVAKLPATAEAFMVNYIDDLDAKMNQVTNLIDNDPGDTDWTAYQRSLETRLYRKRPAADDQ